MQNKDTAYNIKQYLCIAQKTKTMKGAILFIALIVLWILIVIQQFCWMKELHYDFVSFVLGVTQIGGAYIIYKAFKDK